MNKNVFQGHRKKNSYGKDDLLKYKKPVYVKDDLETLNRLFRMYGKTSKRKQSFSGGFFSGGKKGSVLKIPEKNRRVMFKMSYSKSIQSHDKYREYYMPQENKDYVTEKPVLFGFSNEEYEKVKTPLNFKCIISPEDGDVDLKLLTESYIRRLENHTGFSLVWQACIHSDTEHRHAHIVINGKDRNGDDVYFGRDTVRLMRLMCSNAATQIAGYRTEAQIEAARKNLVTAKRWTPLDEKIISSGVDGAVERKGITQELEGRLVFLSSLGLAEKSGDGTFWKLASDMQKKLTAFGRYNSYLEEYAKGGSKELEIYEGGKISGKVEKTVTFDKDESWNDALIIDTGERRVYVPVWQLHRDNLTGKTVTVNGNSGGEGKISRQVTGRDIVVIR